MLQVLKSNKQQKPINPECVHRISSIITPDTELPINLKYISGPVAHNIIPETVTVHRVSRENVLISCPIEESASDERNVLQLRKIYVTPNMMLVKCFLGFENEQKMFSNQNVQNMFKFCQFNADDFAKNVDVEPLPPLSTGGTTRIKGDGLRILNPITKLLKTDKNSGNSGHEKEDSIIFLSKNDLESMTVVNSNPQPESMTSDRMKVFQPTSSKKSWFKNLRSKNNSFTQLCDNMQTKCDSIDRYKDMSKLIQERFGNIEDDDVTRPNETTPPRPSSQIGFKTGDASDTLRKSFSLQELDSQKNLRPNILSSTQDASNSNPKHQKVVTAKPFFSDKLYSEFHVKTKQHSKSSSSLHQLLHLGKTPKTSETQTTKKDEERYPFEIKFEQKTDFPSMFEPYERQDDCSLTILDDLPYSSVRDSIIAQEEERSISPKAPSENIYAELFTQQENDTKKPRDSLERERNVPNFHRISEINNSTRIRICLFNDDPNQSFTAKI